MFNPKEWKLAKDLTVGDLILYLSNHFRSDANVLIDGDNFFHIHAEEDGSTISLDSSSLSDLSELYDENIEKGEVNMKDERSLSNGREVYSEMRQNILKFRNFRHFGTGDKFRDDYYRVIKFNGYNVAELEDKFNMLHHDGFIFEHCVPIKKTENGEEKSLNLLIFVRKSEYM